MKHGYDCWILICLALVSFGQSLLSTNGSSIATSQPSRDLQAGIEARAGNTLSALATLLLANRPSAAWQICPTRCSAARWHRSLPGHARSGHVSLRAVADAIEDANPQELPLDREEAEIEEAEEGSLDFMKVLEILRSAVPQLLQKERNWDVFEKGLTQVHSTIDLGAIELWLQKYPADDVQAETGLPDIDDSGIDHKLLRWKVKLAGVDNDAPVEVESEATYSLNDDNLLEFVSMDNWSESFGSCDDDVEISPADAGSIYRDPFYWDKFFKTELEAYEFVAAYSDLQVIIEDVTRGLRKSRILHVGCGNSELPEEMYDDGYHNIANIDTSEIVISQMRQRNAKRADMTWSVMDALHMTYEDDSFDVIIDKGIVDTFECNDNADLIISTYLKEVVRVLRPGGIFLCISFNDLSKRFETPDLNLKWRLWTPWLLLRKWRLWKPWRPRRLWKLVRGLRDPLCSVYVCEVLD